MLPRTTNNISEEWGCEALMGRLICTNAGLRFDRRVVTQGRCECAEAEESPEDYWAYLHYRHHVDHLSQWSAKIIVQDVTVSVWADGCKLPCLISTDLVRFKWKTWLPKGPERTHITSVGSTLLTKLQSLFEFLICRNQWRWNMQMHLGSCTVWMFV